jgi:protein-S-isoprenylcysteine O-methyltransferase Ste14
MSAVFRTLIFTLLVPGFWTVALPYWTVPHGTRLDVRGAGAVGWSLIVAGGGLYFVCAFWGFAVRSKGTPLPLDPPKKLVANGPYGVVRNPMYWGVAGAMLGEAAVFHSLVLAEWAVGLFVCAHLFVLLVEEPTLRKKFGAEYEEYCRRVPRWIPGIGTS